MPQMNSLVSADASESLMRARSQQMVQQAKAHAGSGDPQIEKSAKAFEAILLDRWLEQAEHSFASVPGGDANNDDPNNNNDGDPGSGQFRSLALQSLAETIAGSGGIGIAAMIVRQLEHKNTEAPQTADSKDHNPVGTDGRLPRRNEIKVSTRKDR